MGFMEISDTFQLTSYYATPLPPICYPEDFNNLEKFNPEKFTNSHSKCSLILNHTSTEQQNTAEKQLVYLLTLQSNNFMLF